ncbi:Ribose methyltransferase [Coemansia spiralis]|nr:Ribose methyltransferase [Coemansia spiralis]
MRALCIAQASVALGRLSRAVGWQGQRRWLGERRWQEDSERGNRSLSAAKKRKRRVAIAADLTNSELLYGIQPVEAALRQQRRALYGLYIPAAYEGDLPRDRLENITKLAQELNLPVARVPMGDLTKAAGGVAHQGVILKAGRFNPPRVTKIREFVGNEYSVGVLGSPDVVHQPRRRLPLWVALDGIQDPHNLGSIVRSAVFFGADAVLTPASGVCQVMPVVSKSSSGAAECAAIYRASNIAVVLERARIDGWSIVCAIASSTPTSKPISSNEVPRLTRPTILVIGSEQSGVSDSIAALSDMNVEIPACAGLPPFIDSLNAGVAAGILLASLKFEGE